MTRIDHEALLLPVSEEAPAGPDLSYDPVREEIEQAFAASSDDVDWDATVRLIAAQAARTRDLWLAVYLARAGARLGRMEVVDDGFALLAGYFEHFWNSVHPTTEEYGIEGRKGACESLARIGEFLAHFRRVPLIEHPRLGRFSGADFERFAAEGAGAEGYGQFRAALADTPIERITEELGRLGGIRESLKRADAILSAEAEQVGQTGTNFSSTYDAIDAIVSAVRPFALQNDAADPASNTGESSGNFAGGKTSVAPAGSSGRIESRADVARALDAVIEYYTRAEPSSPIPVALGRIKGWITMDFISLLNDISPGSRSEALSVLQARADESGDTDLM
ncbi:type VI secretion system protein TssA [Sphingomonas sp. NBWT7]|uniref:type VI secretion system protein TssA n=1 Tax=Sphingomonas sp. NBWT7 TaxID=2596913 RepID=UPI0016258120|nr:type VI secretion system ImpA family N-terminal domain-containing protein [Sphingomonas sp. NBWT7]QNE32485.1 type VI secretion system protein TssA [Sphingomonas sp. NBWT7]